MVLVNCRSWPSSRSRPRWAWVERAVRSRAWTMSARSAIWSFSQAGRRESVAAASVSWTPWAEGAAGDGAASDPSARVPFAASLSSGASSRGPSSSGASGSSTGASRPAGSMAGITKSSLSPKKASISSSVSSGPSREWASASADSMGAALSSGAIPARPCAWRAGAGPRSVDSGTGIGRSAWEVGARRKAERGRSAGACWYGVPSPAMTSAATPSSKGGGSVVPWVQSAAAGAPAASAVWPWPRMDSISLSSTSRRSSGSRLSWASGREAPSERGA